MVACGWYEEGLGELMAKGPRETFLIELFCIWWWLQSIQFSKLPNCTFKMSEFNGCQ